jgi:hypothetical protein
MLASAALLTACEVDPLAPSTSIPVNHIIHEGFMFHHDESVFVIISTSGEDATKFDLTVRVDQKNKEIFEGLDGDTVADIVSEHVSVGPAPIPTSGFG